MVRRSLLLAAALVCAACGKSAPKSSLPEMAKLPGIVAAPATVTGNDQRAALFLTKGCPNCHTISALGIKSSTEAGPDLSIAYDDVKARFGVPLEQFLPNPTGTMQMVLGSIIKLTPAERDSVIHILKQLHEEREHNTQANH
jgi:hypothetical protein